MGNLAASWPLAATHGGRGFRNPLIYGEPAGTRTQGPRLKRAMLYQLSYRLTVRNAVIQPGDCQPPRNQEPPRRPTRNAVDGGNTSADYAV